MKQRIRKDVERLRQAAKFRGESPCSCLVGCPFGGDCEICCYLFPALFDNYMVKRPIVLDGKFNRIFRLYLVDDDGGHSEPSCPCHSLGEDFVTWRIALFMEKGR